MIQRLHYLPQKKRESGRFHEVFVLELYTRVGILVMHIHCRMNNEPRRSTPIDTPLQTDL